MRNPAVVCLLCGLAAALTVMPPPVGAQRAPDRFYVELSSSGIRAAARGDFHSAAGDFRLAAFGLLDYPERLAEVLARLADAQARIEDDEGLRHTLVRLDELEIRFQAVNRTDFPDELRAAIDRAASARLSPAELETIPLVAHLTTPGDDEAPLETEPEPAATMAPPEAEPPAPAPSTPQPATDVSAEPTGVTPEIERQNESPTEPAATPPQPREPRVEAADGTVTRDEQRLADVGRAGRLARSAAEIASALEAAGEIADEDPGWVEAQLVAGQLAYRASRWQDAVTYFERAGEIGADRPAILFYQAVALYEGGRPAEARASLERALPGLQRSPLVDVYLRKIMDSEESASN